MTPRPCSRMSSRSYAGNLFWGAPALMAAQRGKRQRFNKLYLLIRYSLVLLLCSALTSGVDSPEPFMKEVCGKHFEND